MLTLIFFSNVGAMGGATINTMNNTTSTFSNVKRVMNSACGSGC